jgi:predicted Holliday junction resolvase-like endonuclease
MARKRRVPKYAGALAQPIDVGVDQIDRVQEVLTARVPEKIYLLFKHYEVDPSDEQSWQTLALKLAFDHVPGVQLRLAFLSKAGRKPTWKVGLGDELVRAVQDVKSQTGMRTQDAIRKLQQDKPWKRFTVENLGARYREAKLSQRFRKLADRARRQTLDELSGLSPTDGN